MKSKGDLVPGHEAAGQQIIIIIMMIIMITVPDNGFLQEPGPLYKTEYYVVLLCTDNSNIVLQHYTCTIP